MSNIESLLIFSNYRILFIGAIECFPLCHWKSSFLSFVLRFERLLPTRGIFDVFSGVPRYWECAPCSQVHLFNNVGHGISFTVNAQRGQIGELVEGGPPVYVSTSPWYDAQHIWSRCSCGYQSLVWSLPFWQIFVPNYWAQVSIVGVILAASKCDRIDVTSRILVTCS